MRKVLRQPQQQYRGFDPGTLPTLLTLPSQVSPSCWYIPRQCSGFSACTRGLSCNPSSQRFQSLRRVSRGTQEWVLKPLRKEAKVSWGPTQVRCRREQMALPSTRLSPRSGTRVDTTDRGPVLARPEEPRGPSRGPDSSAGPARLRGQLRPGPRRAPVRAA